MKRYERLAVKKPKYYVSIGDIYIEDGAFKAATIYYQKAVDKGVLAYTVLGDTCLTAQDKFKLWLDYFKIGY